jgi:hypothetical protein
MCSALEVQADEHQEQQHQLQPHQNGVQLAAEVELATARPVVRDEQTHNHY